MISPHDPRVQSLTHKEVSGTHHLSLEGAIEVVQLMDDGWTEKNAITQVLLGSSGRTLNVCFPDFLPDRGCSDDELHEIAERVLPVGAELEIDRAGQVLTVKLPSGDSMWWSREINQMFHE